MNIFKPMTLLLTVALIVSQQVSAQIESPGANITKGSMKYAVLDKNGKLPVVASQSSSAADFDFFIGGWNINNKKLQSRLTNCKIWTSFR